MRGVLHHARVHGWYLFVFKTPFLLAVAIIIAIHDLEFLDLVFDENCQNYLVRRGILYPTSHERSLS